MITKCINGALQIGDLVLSSSSCDYKCLVGKVINITAPGTPEHETYNKTVDVHVNFNSEYSTERKAEIEEMFSDFYLQKKTFDELALDEVIMDPRSLIKITDISESERNNLLNSFQQAKKFDQIISRCK